ncbi:MAG: cytochrome c oxidase subunit [Chthoniobacter sp.]|jgi:cytochrome c oxidase subunit 2|nr:cytochrome c oxidase subunit [Chthoniobacter sp.]
MINKFFGIVPNASEHGYLVDHTLEFCHWFMALLFVGWSSFFLYTIFRFHRSRNPKANYHGVHSKASAHLEFTVVLIEAVLLLGFAVPLWGKRVTGESFPDARESLRVRAVAEQFGWNFHYPGPDGVFGKQNLDYIQSHPPLGLDPNDAAGKDDIISKNELHLVNHKPVVIEVTSKDVIHGLSLEHMRISQDAIPGSMIPAWFRPIKKGQYEIVCSQLCGAGHYAMRAQMLVETQAEFDAWMADTVKLQHPDLAPAPAAPAAAAAPAAPAAPAPAAAAPAAPVAR